MVWTCYTAYTRANVNISGTEDAFPIGFYFGASGPLNRIGVLDRGMTYNGGNELFAYRFFVQNPIRFTKSAIIVRMRGDTSQAAEPDPPNTLATIYYYLNK